MMREISIWRLKYKFLQAGLFVGLLFAFLSPCFAVPQTFQINISFPKSSLDFSDLDMRDEFNQPIENRNSKTQLANSISANLNQMLLRNLTPIKQAVYILLSLKWDIISGWIHKTSRQMIRYISIGLNKIKKMKPTIVYSNVVTKVEIIPIAGNSNSFIFLISSLISSIQILR